MIKNQKNRMNLEIANIPSGEGAVVEKNGKSIAAYHDGETVHCFSSKCTHMQCEVEWNDVAKTWDCPCHGARFAPTGAVLKGPAKRPLNPM